MSLALFNVVDGTMTWLGIGNVKGILIRADSKANPRYASLLLRGGMVGGPMRLPHVSVVPVLEGDTLIFATDGIDDRFSEGVVLGGSPKKTADGILARHKKGTDDALVLVTRYVGLKA